MSLRTELIEDNKYGQCADQRIRVCPTLVTCDDRERHPAGAKCFATNLYFRALGRSHILRLDIRRTICYGCTSNFRHQPLLQVPQDRAIAAGVVERRGSLHTRDDVRSVTK